jgi:transcriptional regulator with XRE-family HTH domain
MLKNETKLELCGIDSRIRENLRRLRQEKGMSLRALGKLTAISWLGRVEAGSKTLGKQGLIKVAKCLQVDIAQFLRPPMNTHTGKTEQLLQIFDGLTAEGKTLLIEAAKSIAAYEVRLKWRE